MIILLGPLILPVRNSDRAHRESFFSALPCLGPWLRRLKGWGWNHREASPFTCLTVDAGSWPAPQARVWTRTLLCDPSMWPGLPHSIVASG